MKNVVIYDENRPELAVLSDLRPVFDVRTGCLTTRERLERSLGLAISACFVPPELAELTAEATGETINALPAGADDVLLLNGRCVAPTSELTALAPGAALAEPDTQHIIAARLNNSDACAFLESFELPIHCTVHVASQRCLLHRPWDVIRFRDGAIRQDLELLLAAATPSSPRPHIMTMGGHRIHIHETAKVAPNACLDVEHGPIYIDAGATIRPGAVMVGPAYAGVGSSILEHALIKANTAIGPMCKAAGEVGGTIMQSHSNKGHDGHIGDSWIGQWVNLGAGTTNSNLLNTYGVVTAAATPKSSREKTGLTFFGAIFGDHVKTAICTRIMTGSILGTGAMIACTALPPNTVRRFAWLTDSGESRFRLDRFLETAERMMARRSQSITPAMRERLARLHEHTFGAAS